MLPIEKEEIVKMIPWNRNWDELSIEDKANFMILIHIGILNSETLPMIENMYEALQFVFEERGIDNMVPYFANDDFRDEIQLDLQDLER